MCRHIVLLCAARLMLGAALRRGGQLAREDDLAGFVEAHADDVKTLSKPEKQAKPDWLRSLTGPCTTTSSCVRSPNYPNDYGSGEGCVLTVESSASSVIAAESFDTEMNFDQLNINGISYSGLLGPTYVTPTADIVWTSDDALTKEGWELCTQAPAPAPAYELRSSGSCMHQVMSLAQCSFAALALGLPDVSAASDGQTGATGDPPYCYVELGSVKFNQDGSNTGNCSYSDWCVCSTRAPGPTPAPSPPPGPAPTPAQEYEVRTTGSCTYHVTTIDQCSFAAASVGLSNMSALDDAQTAKHYDPPYCYFEQGLVKFNKDGSNTGICKHNDQCICAVSAPAPTPAPLYELRSSGSCMYNFLTIAQCSRAAAALLDLPRVNALNDDQAGVPHDPPYCYFEFGSVKFNARGTNTGSCSPHDRCICATSAQDPNADNPAAQPQAPQAPTPAPTAAAEATGDPHITNLIGRSFDVRQPGEYTLARLPKDGAAALKVDGSIQSIGNACSMFITEVNITGVLLNGEFIRARASRQSAYQNHHREPTAFSLQLAPGAPWIPLSSFPAGDAVLLKNYSLHGVKVEIKAKRDVAPAGSRNGSSDSGVHGFFMVNIIAPRQPIHTQLRLSKRRAWLNVHMARLGQLGFAEVGGILGTTEPDERWSEPTRACQRHKAGADASPHVNLLQVDSMTREDSSIASATP